jgi:hypothetical protein
MVVFIRVVKAYIFGQIISKLRILYSPLGAATYLTDKFGLKCTTHKAPKGSGEESLRIYISATSLKLVQTLVSKHMHPSFLYKIGL